MIHLHVNQLIFFNGTPLNNAFFISCISALYTPVVKEPAFSQ